jgi:hypothetical protein
MLLRVVFNPRKSEDVERAKTVDDIRSYSFLHNFRMHDLVLLVGPRLMRRDHAVKKSFRVCSVATVGNQSDCHYRVGLRRDIHILCRRRRRRSSLCKGCLRLPLARDAFGFLLQPAAGICTVSGFFFSDFTPLSPCGTGALSRQSEPRARRPRHSVTTP